LPKTANSKSTTGQKIQFRINSLILWRVKKSTFVDKYKYIFKPGNMQFVNFLFSSIDSGKKILFTEHNNHKKIKNDCSKSCLTEE